MAKAVVSNQLKKALQTDDSGATTESFAQLIKAMQKSVDPTDFAGGRLKRASISEQVSNRILAMIKSGNLESEDQLPTEPQMCFAFGISRPPLREALKALTLMGVLESRQGGVIPFQIFLPAA